MINVVNSCVAGLDEVLRKAYRSVTQEDIASSAGLVNVEDVQEG